MARPRRYAVRVNPFVTPADRKKVTAALYKRFKGMGDGTIIGGKHKIMLATEGYRTLVLEDAPDDEIIRLARKHGLLHDKPRSNPRKRTVERHSERARENRDAGGGGDFFSRLLRD